jgi:hypothetical protein
MYLLRVCTGLFDSLSARITTVPVNADRPPAGCAGPAFFLVFDKIPDTPFLDRFKVPEHTHAIVLPVPGIQLHKPPARERGAGKTILTLQVDAGTDRTVFMVFPVRRPAPDACIFCPQKSHADCTVHATGSNEFCFHQIIGNESVYRIVIINDPQSHLSEYHNAGYLTFGNG